MLTVTIVINKVHKSELCHFYVLFKANFTITQRSTFFFFFSSSILFGLNLRQIKQQNEKKIETS